MNTVSASHLSDPAHPNCQRNWLVERLSAEFRRRNSAHLQPFEVSAKEVLCESGKLPDLAFFPVDCVTVQLAELKTGESTAISVIGREGMVNLELLFGAPTTMWSTVVVNHGSVLRIPMKLLQAEFETNGQLRVAVLACLQYRLFQTSQLAACYQQHSIEQQICRWLMTVRDHVMSDVIHVTHQVIAAQLGIRREAVSVSALALQEQRLIANARGNITILDADRLEHHACECYASIRQERDRMRPSLSVQSGTESARAA
jgi:CRP-like cAMP-binding protein